MIRLGTVVMGAEDVARAVAFWSDTLAYEVVSFPEADDGFTILRPPSREGTRLAIHHTDTPPQDKPRIHLDLIVDTSAAQVTEVDRLVGLGATRVAWVYPDDPDFVVLADTEGNCFCVVDVSHG